MKLAAVKRHQSVQLPYMSNLYPPILFDDVLHRIEVLKLNNVLFRRMLLVVMQTCGVGGRFERLMALLPRVLLLYL